MKNTFNHPPMRQTSQEVTLADHASDTSQQERQDRLQSATRKLGREVARRLFTKKGAFRILETGLTVAGLVGAGHGATQNIADALRDQRPSATELVNSVQSQEEQRAAVVTAIEQARNTRSEQLLDALAGQVADESQKGPIYGAPDKRQMLPIETPSQK